jgi:pyruvate/2-oxoglutarate/acetoin dehydrogenase E1 component
MINPVNPIQIAGAGMVASSRGSRATVPVSQADFIYSQFKHVSGVPAPKGTNGVAVSKIKILDTLIEHLSQSRRSSAQKSDIDPTKISEKQLDFFIQNLQKDIQRISASNIPYAPNPQVAAGTFVQVKV